MNTIEIIRMYVGVSLALLSIALILHIVAITQDHWKIYEHRTDSRNTLYIGIFRRCASRSISPDTTTYFICDENKYCSNDNPNCLNLTKSNPPNPRLLDSTQNSCNLNHTALDCGYSPVTKGLISCTIIAACFLGVSLLLIFPHILINQYKYKIHLYITIITIPLLFLGFLFLLITLILFGATMKYDLYQYRYNLDNRLKLENATSLKEDLRKNVTTIAAGDYDIRLYWTGGLEICALILSSFTLVIQMIYAISIHRNRIG